MSFLQVLGGLALLVKMVDSNLFALFVFAGVLVVALLGAGKLSRAD